MTTFKLRKIIIIATVLFLLLQFVAISFGQVAVNSFLSYNTKTESQQLHSVKQLFMYLLNAQSQNLETFKDLFDSAKIDITSEKQVEQTLKKLAATSTNLPGAPTIYMASRKTRDLIYPDKSLGFDIKNDSAAANSLFSYEQNINRNFIVSLDNEPNIPVAEAKDFERYPLGDYNRIFIQKIVLPSPVETNDNFIIFAYFEEEAISKIIDTSVPQSATTMVHYIIITFSTILFSTIIFSIVMLAATFKLGFWLKK